MKIPYWFLCFVFILQVAHCCYDENGNVVDYFIVYKVPKLENSSNNLIRNGYGYAYMSSSSSKSWHLSKRSISDKNSILGLTLKPIFDNNRKVDNKKTANLIAYSDQPPIYNGNIINVFNFLSNKKNNFIF